MLGTLIGIGRLSQEFSVARRVHGLRRAVPQRSGAAAVADVVLLLNELLPPVARGAASGRRACICQQERLAVPGAVWAPGIGLIAAGASRGIVVGVALPPLGARAVRR